MEISTQCSNKITEWWSNLGVTCIGSRDMNLAHKDCIMLENRHIWVLGHDKKLATVWKEDNWLITSKQKETFKKREWWIKRRTNQTSARNIWQWEFLELSSVSLFESDGYKWIYSSLKVNAIESTRSYSTNYSLNSFGSKGQGAILEIKGGKCFCPLKFNETNKKLPLYSIYYMVF